MCTWINVIDFVSASIQIDLFIGIIIDAFFDDHFCTVRSFSIASQENRQKSKESENIFVKVIDEYLFQETILK